MVYVKYESTGVDKFKTCVDAPFVFVILDRNRVSRFWRKSLVDNVLDTGWTFTTGYVDIALEVLEYLE